MTTDRTIPLAKPADTAVGVTPGPDADPSTAGTAWPATGAAGSTVPTPSAAGSTIPTPSAAETAEPARDTAASEDTLLPSAPDDGGAGQGDGPKPGKGGGGLRGHRLVWLIAGVAVVSLAAGVGLSTLIKSPAEQAAAAAPPKAGLVTAPVESRVLANDVTTRADAAFEDAVDVRLSTGEIEGGVAPYVTGQVPEVGTELTPAAVALEVSGRPVIVLPGELPAYRTLRAGSAGPDVAQLKAALRELGLDPGKGKDDVYDVATASAVQKLYAKVGYPAPTAGESIDEQVKSARDGVNSAQQALDQANAEYTAGLTGTASNVDKLSADNAVREAQRALDAAQADGGDVAKAQDDLALAQAQRAELDKPKDTTALSLAVSNAQRALKDAKDTLSAAQEGALTPLPVSEVLYLANTPRRVDAVNVKRGDPVSGTVMSVSGANLLLKASVAEADAKLLKAGATGTVTMPDDSEMTVTVTSVEPKKSGSGDSESGSGSGDKAGGRYDVALQPEALTPAQIEMLRGENVRVVIPVDSTGGEVLAVPIAALTAGPGGEARVEVEHGRDTDMITVTPGLAAGGFVEIASAEGELSVGDRVVVGR